GDIAPSIALLRRELTLRDQERANANGEIERLKDVVRKILYASRRESLVFHYNMAAIYRASMMYKKAEEEYLKALAIDPADAGVHYNLAILYDDNFKNKKKAKFHYEKFLELAPDDPDAPKVREWLATMIQ
ncbi:MAG: tetratricopeptide repeat protein, partial [Kiritimatiellae bacterium]|nr:tetratricopeptide repeat protein [Kiritimatiellia bacterium]